MISNDEEEMDRLEYWREQAEKAENNFTSCREELKDVKLELAKARRCLSFVECKNCKCFFSEDPTITRCARSDHVNAFNALTKVKQL